LTTDSLAEPFAAWQSITRANGHACRIRKGKAPIGSPVGRPVRVEDGWEIRYEDGAWYRVVGADPVIIDIGEAAGDPETAMLRRSGPVAAMVMVRAGFFPLHACGIVTPGGCAAVFAPSGGGKSTFAALAAASGLPIAGDDLLALHEDGLIAALPGSLRVSPADAPVGWTAHAVLADGRGWYPLEPLRQSPPLSALIHLTRGENVGLAPVTGARRLASIGAAGIVSLFDDDPAGPWQQRVLNLAARTPVWELTVPEGLEKLRCAWPTIERLLVESCR
jgi:hypothetical protein